MTAKTHVYICSEVYLKNEKTNPLQACIAWQLPLLAKWKQEWMTMTDNKIDKYISAWFKAGPLILV